MVAAYVHSSGIAQKVKNIYVHSGGGWRTVQKGWVHNGGVWRLFYQRMFFYTYSATQANANLVNDAGGVGWDGASPITVTINAGITLYGTSSGVYAFDIGAGIANTSIPVIIINNGSIIGKGGNAPQTGDPSGTGTVAASPGGNAVLLRSTTTIQNNGYIAGGGGGGGTGGLGADGFGGSVGTGGGGGGGAGYVPGAGGIGEPYNYFPYSEIVIGNPGSAGSLYAGGNSGLGGFANGGADFGGTGGPGGAAGQPGHPGNGYAAAEAPGASSPTGDPGGAAGYSVVNYGYCTSYSGTALVGPTA